MARQLQVLTTAAGLEHAFPLVFTGTPAELAVQLLESRRALRDAGGEIDLPVFGVDHQLPHVDARTDPAASELGAVNHDRCGVLLPELAVRQADVRQRHVDGRTPGIARRFRRRLFPGLSLEQLEPYSLERGTADLQATREQGGGREF